MAIATVFLPTYFVVFLLFELLLPITVILIKRLKDIPILYHDIDELAKLWQVRLGAVTTNPIFKQTDDRSIRVQM